MTSATKELTVITGGIICILLITSFSTYIAAGNDVMTPAKGEGIIRLHIVAGSDEELDQELKLLVRDEVLEAVNEKLVRETMVRHDAQNGHATLTIDESRESIKNNLREIEKVAQNVISENGHDYIATAELGVRWIPEKRYGDITFPAGNYEALNITIGEGAGENWWCVLFPPLCLIDARRDYGEIEMDGINAAEWVAEGPGWPMNQTVRLRFRTVEIIDSLTN